jgi:DNA-binding MarR family transcriptional regulator
MPTRPKNAADTARRAPAPRRHDSTGTGHRTPPGAESETERLLRRWRDVAPRDRLAHLVKDAMRALDRALQLRLAEHAVALGHWPFLRVLWESDGLTQRELSREAGVMEPTTFAAVKAMAALGYVVRRQLDDNRRKNHVFLTAKGRALERALVPLAEEVNRTAVRGAPVDDIVAARRLLLKVLENLTLDERDSSNARRRIPSTRELGRRVDSAERR